MNKIIQHIPACVETDIKREDFFCDINQLLNIKWVKKFETIEKEFYRWSIDKKLLIAEYNNGEKWWVVGYIEKPNEIDLPKPTYKKA